MDFERAARELQENGFAIIENFLSEEEISSLKSRMHEIVENVNPQEHQTVFSTTNQTRNDYFMNSGDRISFFFEEGAIGKEGNLLVEKQMSINKVGHALHCQDSAFSKVTQSDKIKNLSRAIGFTDPVICQSMYIFKQPKIGGVVTPHQDSTFLNTSPKRLVGVWIPLEDALKDNSCLWFIPGSHKNGVHNDRFMVRNPEDGPDKPAIIFTNPASEYDNSKFVPAEMKAGSLALIHGEVVHKSEPNLSTRSRHAYTFHMFDAFGVEYSNQNWLQPTEKGSFTHLLNA
ncbi:phytanoyl-CoA dioxygenase domain-containing protein 1 [Aplysia californica]|uniref:Phytanoyl-CoA dioxygenase domain-containing protein 1 n=1 Tax=Aplysia californica TaxID=6500 RepID=A0ABM0ZUY8_APLCA|nr:phytanoyl-CoA dioxygenase domain-containing protein 1 [Aplysia californica]